MTPVLSAPRTGSKVSSMEGAPAHYQLPLERPDLEQAKRWCRNLVTTHYENFHVATWFLPRPMRPHFDALYAYCRVADDFGDEVSDAETAIRLLDTWDAMLDECFDAPHLSRHPVFVALHETITSCQPPRQLFHDLVSAFRMDQTKTQYASLAELEAYSRGSANPVGRLVLWICGYRDESLALLSDKVCTGLQLANCWQDVVEDWQRGRRYLPAELMQRFGVTDEQIATRSFTPAYRALVEHLVGLTRTMLREGGEISSHVDGELSPTLDLFRRGGESILDAIEAREFDTLRGRPTVSKSRKLRLLAGAVWGKLAGAEK